MGKKEDLERRTEELASGVLEKLGLSLYDVEYVKEGKDHYLRVFIDREGGVSVEDCENVSREMNPLLDKEDAFLDPYIFEVSSPGLTRTLKKDRHFEKSLGEAVEVKLFEPQEKQKEWEGTLETFDHDTVTIRTEEGKEMTFKRSGIASIKLLFQF